MIPPIYIEKTNNWQWHFEGSPAELMLEDEIYSYGKMSLLSTARLVHRQRNDAELEMKYVFSRVCPDTAWFSWKEKRKIWGEKFLFVENSGWQYDKQLIVYPSGDCDDVKTFVKRETENKKAGLLPVSTRLLFSVASMAGDNQYNLAKLPYHPRTKGVDAWAKYRPDVPYSLHTWQVFASWKHSDISKWLNQRLPAGWREMVSQPSK